MSEKTSEKEKIEEMSFRAASVELEKIVRDLERGDLELEDSLELYQRGVEILKDLRHRLATAEQKVQVLLDATNEDAEVTDTTSAPSTAYLDE